MGTTGAVVALKVLDRAKSRFASLPDPLRRRLAWTMALDTLRALSVAVSIVVVVTDQPGVRATLALQGLDVVVRPEPAEGGLNVALTVGAHYLREHAVPTVLACVGDLPALRPASVTAVLDAAAGRDRSYLADAAGTGTTMLVASAVPLDPRFSGASAAAHQVSGAVPLVGALPASAVARARRDVDCEADLHEGFLLGLGRSTAALLDPVSGRLGRYEERRLQTGELLHVVRSGTEVLSAWREPDDPPADASILANAAPARRREGGRRESG